MSNARLRTSVVVMMFSASTPASALDCPLLKDNSARNWAAYFLRNSPVIFRGKVISLRFVGMTDAWLLPKYSVTYRVIEKIQGSVPQTFTSTWTSWCDSCSITSARRIHHEMIGQEYIIQGGLSLAGISKSFMPQMCFGFIDLPFRWADGDLLSALRETADASKAPN